MLRSITVLLACSAIACSSSRDEVSTQGTTTSGGGGSSAISSSASTSTTTATSASAGGGSIGGSSGCPASDLVGWASVSDHGVTTTIGGGNATPVMVTSAAELAQYAADPQPQVIQVSGTIEIAGLDVASNKTIVGMDATIQGGIRIRGDGPDPSDMVSNVIIANLRVNAATAANDGDGMQIYYAHHVWVDHVEVWDAPDGNLDIVHASDLVTVSWSKFYYSASPPDPDHRFSNLLGHSDNNGGEDTGRLRITFHHDWWADNVVERMPRVRFGQVHVFDNYYSATGNNYAIGAALEASLVIENNYFDDVHDPHVFYGGEPTAQIAASGNTYVGVSDTSAKDSGQGSAFQPPYAATLETADAALKTLVTGCAGPR